MKRYVALRKVAWDQLWHAIFQIRGRLAWDRVSLEKALELSERLENSECLDAEIFTA